jgi:hypothetical protein
MIQQAHAAAAVAAVAIVSELLRLLLPPAANSAPVAARVPAPLTVGTQLEPPAPQTHTDHHYQEDVHWPIAVCLTSYQHLQGAPSLVLLLAASHVPHVPPALPSSRTAMTRPQRAAPHQQQQPTAEPPPATSQEHSSSSSSSSMFTLECDCVPLRVFVVNKWQHLSHRATTVTAAVHTTLP